MRKVMALTVVALLVAGGIFGWWWRLQTAWRGVVPLEQPVMAEEVAWRAEAEIGIIWLGGSEAAKAAGELAQLYHANGHRAEAEQVYRGILERIDDPSAAQGAYLLSELLGTSGRLEEAERWLARVVAWEPDNVLARRKQADLLLKTGRLEEAAAAYDAVLATAPTDPYALLGRARVEVEDDRWLDARRRLETLVGAHPSFAGGLSLLATVDDVLGETARATEMRRRAESAGRFREQNDPRLEALLAYCFSPYDLRVAAAVSDDDERAEALLRRAADLAPDEAANWQQLGRVRQRRGDRDGAEVAFERALRAAPANGQVWLDLVGLARERKDLAAVLRTVEAGIEACPDEAGLHYEQGRARVQAERLNEAVAPLERAVALDPFNQTAAMDLVALWFRLEEEKKAAAVMESALARDPDHAAMLELWVRYHVRGGRQVEASAALERLARAPNNETAWANARREFEARFGAP